MKNLLILIFITLLTISCSSPTSNIQPDTLNGVEITTKLKTHADIDSRILINGSEVDDIPNTQTWVKVITVEPNDEVFVEVDKFNKSSGLLQIRFYKDGELLTFINDEGEEEPYGLETILGSRCSCTYGAELIVPSSTL